MKKFKIKKTYILIVIYVFLVVAELFYYVPYHMIKLFRTENNVSRTEIIGSGYTTMDNIKRDTADLSYIVISGKKYIDDEGKIVNTPQIFLNVAVTTFLAISIYFLLRQRKPKQTVENNTDKLIERAIKEKDVQLQQALRDVQIFKAQNMSMSNTINELSRKYTEVLDEKIKQMPVLDINGLMFADDETIAQAQIDYAKQMAEYVKNRKEN